MHRPRPTPSHTQKRTDWFSLGAKAVKIPLTNLPCFTPSFFSPIRWWSNFFRLLSLQILRRLIRVARPVYISSKLAVLNCFMHLFFFFFETYIDLKTHHLMLWAPKSLNARITNVILSCLQFHFLFEPSPAWNSRYSCLNLSMGLQVRTMPS